MDGSKKLNILHVSTHLNLGGIASYIGTLAKALSKKGHRNAALSAGGNAVPLLTRAGVSCYHYPIQTKSELHPKLYWNLPRIIRMAREEKFDLVHGHSRVAQVLSFFISKACGIPFVSTAHGFYTPRLGRRLFPFWGSRVIAISELVQEELSQRHHVDEAMIRMVHNAIDFEGFDRRLGQQDRERIRRRFGIPLDAYVVGNVSRLVRDKGHEYLIEAVQKIRQTNQSVFLLIVGHGREQAALERQASESLKGAFKLIPGVLDTTGVLSAMDLFVHPATYREGFGLSMAEAMAAGLPVIATDIPAINTLLKNGVNGRIVPPKDARALADAIEEIMADRALSQRLSHEGRATARAICDPERQASEVEKVYMEAVSLWKKN